jgi:ABC-type tungstate transport system permease subunit
VKASHLEKDLTY